MEDSFHFPVVLIALAILIAGLSLPLILRKVPMNHFYGVRFPESFQSQSAWYEINTYGGKALMVASGPILVIGVYGMLDASARVEWVGTLVVVVALLVATLACYRKARSLRAR